MISRICQDCGARIRRGRLCSPCRRKRLARKETPAEHAERNRRLEQRQPEVVAIWQSPAWRRAAAAARARDGGCVVGHGCAGKLEVHHVIPLNKGGDPVGLDNLVTLCSRHHRLVERGLLQL
jgi:HNH endonuclease